MLCAKFSGTGPSEQSARGKNLLLLIVSLLFCILAACRREEEAPKLLAWIAKSRLKQGKNSLIVARFGNLAEPDGGFSGFSDNLLEKCKTNQPA